MKKALIGSLVLAGMMLSGCFAAGVASPIPGFLWGDVKAPREGLSDAADMKAGMATCKSILGWVALGDCSVEAAKRAGGLSKVQYVDVKVKNYVGVYAEYTTVVKGQ